MARGEAGEKGLDVGRTSDLGVGTLAFWNDASNSKAILNWVPCLCAAGLGLEARQAVEEGGPWGLARA